ncbi:MAG: hypothetical protein H6562_18050 [Lewinellaceae bacterium]|nr:hypothetical protein [Lewinella sp.]MCB9280798.1 hypothetical protein [Lewinellaceae bacterium]
MVIRCYIPALFLLMNAVAGAQPPGPVISNVSSTVDAAAGVARIDFDALDENETSIGIRFSVTDRQGRFVQPQPATVSGDVGPSVAPGPGKSITWRFRDAEMDPDNAKFRIVVWDKRPVPAEELLAKVDTGRMKRHLVEFSILRDHESEEGQRNLPGIRDSLAAFLTRQGVQTLTQDYTFGGMTGRNVLGQIEGSGPAPGKVIALSHYDAVRDNTDDLVNTTGVSGVLEIMAVFAGYQTENTVVGAAFDMAAYEYIGSNHYIYHGGLKWGEKVLGAFYLDLIGAEDLDPDLIPPLIQDLVPDYGKPLLKEKQRGSFTGLIANPNSLALGLLFERSAHAFAPGLQVLPIRVPGYGEDAFMSQDGDHSAFWYSKNPAVFITTGRNRNLERGMKEDDPLQRTSLKTMKDVVSATVAAMTELARPMRTAVYQANFSNRSE